MAEPSLNGKGVLALIRQPITAGMAEHVWMHSKVEAGRFAGSLDNALKRLPSHRAAAFADKDVVMVAAIAVQFP